MPRIIVELSHTSGLEAGAAATMGDRAAPGIDLPALPGIDLDTSYGAVPLPARVPRERTDSPFDLAPAFELDTAPGSSTYLVRGEVPNEDAADALRRNPNVIEVYADVEIEPMAVCPGDPAVGTDTNVANLLNTSAMKACGMDGAGVLVAVVDTGVNMAYLQSKGKSPGFDAARSWSYDPAAAVPGQVPVNHGTMCAYDVCIAAPAATILDVVLLRPLSAPPGGTIMSGLLSDAVKAYRHLINVMLAPQRPGENRSLVVTNSWGMFRPTWDFPVGNPGNYSDNPNHPFNRIVGDLERAGADILFAAGNCGSPCPDGRCGGITVNAIYGANSHPQVLSVAGVDTTKVRAGYSTVGPGRLTQNKPDLAGYTHFKGSGVYPADGGTSAATPVVAGVVAAVRSKRPYNAADPVSHPAAIRSLLTSTAEDLGPIGFDFLHGYGVVNGVSLRARLCSPLPHNLCDRFPWLPFCNPCLTNPASIRCLCQRFPHLPICRLVPIPAPPLPAPPIALRADGGLSANVQPDGFAEVTDGGGTAELAALLEAAYTAGFEAAAGLTMPAASRAAPSADSGCGCGGG